MTPEFDDWWNDDLLTQTNPYREGSPIYWAWEGWYHGVKQEREACALECEKSDRHRGEYFADKIRARGEK